MRPSRRLRPSRHQRPSRLRPTGRVGPAALLATVLVGLLGAALLAPAPVAAEDERAAAVVPASAETISVEVPPEEGAPGGYRDVPVAPPTQGAEALRGDARAGRVDGKVRALSKTGPSRDRLDVVITGDGYTAAQQDDFRADARARWQQLTSIEPYKSYRGLMNVWMVQAVSRDSGIDRDRNTDPGNVNDKRTALGAYFWCNGLERLICVNVRAVGRYAAKAPQAELAVVVANSSRYGGAGYFDGLRGLTGIATLSSDNPYSSEIGSHEVGHALGKLADEYWSCGSCGYGSTREAAEPNVTVHGSVAYLRDNSRKWYRWLGETDPTGGTVGVHQGGKYVARGIWRPTENSIMRSLGLGFNLPGQESMINGFYRYAQPVSSNVRGGTRISRTRLIKLRLASLGDLAALQVRWYRNGKEVVAARGRTTLRPSALGVPARGRHTVKVRVADRTGAVRSPRIRANAARTISWTVR
ncbi:M64 family metallopeptidase [Nocardioides sambongensis]|uniref:M64 family metallopeptidase n=1 Tax=Nocardioides sambongensis TaxID=2589074 RepID=UPI0011275F30|nr:M64 family metallopeptidase [Nocardioides sambongensis]